SRTRSSLRCDADRIRAGGRGPALANCLLHLAFSTNNSPGFLVIGSRAALERPKVECPISGLTVPCLDAGFASVPSKLKRLRVGPRPALNDVTVVILWYALLPERSSPTINPT